MSNTGDLITRVYSNFRGVDFRGEDINIRRSPDSLNVWKDYKETESIRTRPALALKGLQGRKINGIFFYQDGVYVHSGNTLYRAGDDGGVGVINGKLNDAPSCGFVYDEYLYILDGAQYWRLDGVLLSPVEGYIPTTRISSKEGGEARQDCNMLTPKRINLFRGDEATLDFYLDSMNIDSGANKVIVKVDDEIVPISDYTVDYAKGIISFKQAPKAPLTDGQDNISVQYSKTIDGYREAIMKCTAFQIFDDRVFFSGNKEYPNMVWHCSLNDPTYISDQDYYREGRDDAPVRGMVAGNNALWVFREPSEQNTTVFYHSPAIDEEYGVIYTPTHSSIALGCVGKAINFNDDIVFFSDRGMEGISADVTTEQVAAHRSTVVDRKLIAEPNYKDMILCEWEGYLFVFIDNKAYLADSRAVYTNENHIEYDWFYWEFDKKITCAKVNDGVMYVGTEDGLYTLTDTTKDIESYWVTPKDKFKYPHMQKTTNKRGCVAEATGDVSVYAKTEKTEFELIGEFANVTDYFVSRIKRKKFKDIQLKFHSKTRFSLESVSLECWIGGYIKR